MVGTFPHPQVKDDATLLEGGLDQVTPTLKLPAGALRESINWEHSPFGGYRYADGYERYDGLPSPSSAVFRMVALSHFEHVPTAGEILTGLASGATGIILAVVNDAPTEYLAVYLTSGHGFDSSEVVTVGPTTIGTTVAPTELPDAQQMAQWTALAADIPRALISAVPGIGPVRGFFGLIVNGKLERYAVRDGADTFSTDSAVKSLFYRATAAGWVRIDKYMQVAFSTGNGAIPQAGDTIITGSLSSVIARVVLEAGTFLAGTASGRLILPWPNNLFTGAATIGSTTLTILHTPTYIAPSPGGRYETDLGNFAGQLATQRIYGVDGVNPAFEFDGMVYTPIFTGLVSSEIQAQATTPTADRPSHVKVHHNHLMLSIGSSVLNSGVGTPFNFTALAGAVETATGDTVTGMQVLPGSTDSAALAVYNRNHTHVLYGTSAANWKLVSLESETGAVPYSIQTMEQLYALDDRGVVGFRTANEFGNFLANTHTQRIQPFIDGRRGRLLCSSVNRSKNQLRLFFNDGYGLYLTITNGKLRGASPMFFAHRFNCAWSGETESGSEVCYVGGTDGVVYQLDRGTSCDGQDIETVLVTNWNPLKSPRSNKHFERASFSIAHGAYAEMHVHHEIGYGDVNLGQAADANVLSDLQAIPQWDHPEMTWESFTWDGRALESTDVRLGGDGVNIRYVLHSKLNYLPSFTLSAVITSYWLRGRLH